MLRFERKLPPKTATILEHAIDFAVSEIEFIIDEQEIGTMNTMDAIEELSWILPNAASVFTPSVAIGTLTDLKSHIWDKTLYYLNDYHYLLLYDVYSVFAEIHNDQVEEADNTHKKQLATIGKYVVNRVDFDDFLNYFWDVDFLMDPQTMLALPGEIRESLFFNQETFGLTQGLQPHPEELVLVPYEEYIERKDKNKHNEDILAAQPMDIAQGAAFWAALEKNLPPYKNLKIENATAIADKIGVDFHVFGSFDPKVHKKIAKLYPHPESMSFSELGQVASDYISNHSGRPVVWMKTLFPNTVTTALFFRALAAALIHKYYPGGTGKDIMHLIKALSRKYPAFIGERLFRGHHRIRNIKHVKPL